MRRALVQLCRAALGLFALIFAAVLVCDRRVAYALSGVNVPLAPNVALLLVALLLIGAGVLLWTRVRKGSAGPTDEGTGRERRLGHACVVVPLVLLAYQLFVYFVAGVSAGWDVWFLQRASVADLSAVQSSEEWIAYFSMYPNNLFLLWVLRAIEAVRSVVTPFLAPATLAAAASCVAVSLSCLLFMRVADKSVSSWPVRVGSVCVFVALVGMSPWFMIPYSDTFALLACMTMLWCRACGRGWWTRWLLLGLVAALGYAIKPTVIFAFAAIVLTAAMVREWRSASLRPVVRAAACSLVGFAVGFALSHVAVASLGLSLRADQQFSATHFLMMGLNEEAQGIYSWDDVLMSQAAKDAVERREMNLTVARQRAAALGPSGMARLLGRKALIAFNDGTFAWGVEGNFFAETRAGDSPASRAVSSFYYPDGSRYPVFCTVEQTLWLLVLLGIPLGLFGLAGRGVEIEPRRLALFSAMLASLVMLTLFLLLFEVRARYLYLYGGYFVLLAALGFEGAFDFARRRAACRLSDCS